MMKFAFTLMVNPSGKFPYGETPVSIVISTFVVLLGMISLTGGTVGYVTSIMMNVLEQSTHSNSKLKLKNHIVILNWNHKAASLVCDYAFDSVKDTYIVVLTEKDRKEVKQAIDQALSGLKDSNQICFKNIIVRTGSPMSKGILDDVALYAAKTVMIMAPERDGSYSKEEADQIENFSVSKLFMFVSAYFKNTKEKRTQIQLPEVNLITEIPDHHLEKMITQYEVGQNQRSVTAINYNEILRKIFAISTLMPSLNSVMLHMFSFAGVELYVAPHNGLSIEEDIKMQETALPLYDLDKEHRVYLAEDENAIISDQAKKYTLKKPLLKEYIIPQVITKRKEILIIGCNDKLAYILESLLCFKKEYPMCELHVVLLDVEANKDRLAAYYMSGQYDLILKGATHDYNDAIIVDDIFEPEKSIPKELREITSVVLFLSDENTKPERIDEKPLLLWGNLKRSRLDRENEMRHYVIELLNPQNETIIDKGQKDKVIISDRFLSCIYAQLSKDPTRLDIMKDFITFEEDQASMNHEDELINDCNLLSIKVGQFFKGHQVDLCFTSKRELVLWIYKMTHYIYMPLGYVRDGVDYLFPRHERVGDELDSSVLMDKTGKIQIDEGKISLKPDDELILLKFTENEACDQAL